MPYRMRHQWDVLEEHESAEGGGMDERRQLMRDVFDCLRSREGQATLAHILRMLGLFGVNMGDMRQAAWQDAAREVLALLYAASPAHAMRVADMVAERELPAPDWRGPEDGAEDGAEDGGGMQ